MQDEPVKTFEIINGDCTIEMHKLWFSGRRFDMIFADPPFNIGQNYDIHDDRLSVYKYGAFTDSWLRAAFSCLSENGNFCIHVGDSVVPLIFKTMEQIASRKDWIVWHYRFGQSGSAAKSTKCINSKAHLLVYTRPGATSTWNPPMVPSDRATKYGDARTMLSDTPGMRVALDVWGPSDGEYWGRVNGNSNERWVKAFGAAADHENQLPEVYVARAMKAWSNKGDSILCPFGGSGTETVVALALKRFITTIELSPTYCESIRLRVARGAIRV